jgi:hypothetical protein
MNPYARVGVALLACLAFLIGGVGIARKLAQNDGDLTPLLGPVAAYEEALTRKAELDDRAEAVRRCYAAKLATVRDVADGRITLLQAATRFHDADDGVFVYDPLKLNHYPGRTPLERRCREVLAWVQGILRNRPEERAVVLPPLNAQFEEYLRRGGAPS